MTPLRLGVVVLAAAFVLAVWLYNKWQERRARQSVEGPFSGSRPDVLLERSEPTLAAAGRSEPHLGGAGGAPEAPLSSDPGPIEPDAAIHALIPVKFDQPVSGDRLAASFHPLRHAGRQRASVLGGQDGRWFAPRPGARFDDALVAVQLANRSGPLNEIEFSEFVAQLEQIATQLGALCEVPDMRETIARARALDARCAPLDRQVGITLANPAGRWTAEQVAHQAEELGMVLRSDGRFHALDAGAATLYTLQNADGPAFRLDTLASASTARLILLLDVPCAPADVDPYGRMTDAALALAGRLDAVLVDDQLRTLTPGLLAAIGQQIAPVYAELTAHGMPAGSARALALFS